MLRWIEMVPPDEAAKRDYEQLRRKHEKVLFSTGIPARFLGVPLYDARSAPTEGDNMGPYANNDFKETLIADCIVDDALDKAIEWIRDNLSPDEVFVEEHLTEWAMENLSNLLSVDEVYAEPELVEWATENGFVRAKEE
jgi:hypothetical protein